MLSIDEAARQLGIDLLPWQREIGQRVLSGEQVIIQRGRRGGLKTLKRVIENARRSEA